MLQRGSRSRSSLGIGGQVPRSMISMVTPS
jgi:hypothetical protein